MTTTPIESRLPGAVCDVRAEALSRACELLHSLGHEDLAEVVGEAAFDRRTGNDPERWAKEMYGEPVTAEEVAKVRTWLIGLGALPPNGWRRAQVGHLPLWMHTCGRVQAISDEDRHHEEFGICEGCDTGREYDADDWRPLYLPNDPAAAEEASVR